MGFFESLMEGYDNETARIAKSKSAHGSYKTVKEREQAAFAALDAQSDGVLLNKLKASFISETDKKTIISILQGRGYRRNNKGQFDRI